MKRVIVAGGGASGMMAAIAAAREGADVTILEAGRKPGRKLLMTGNGRCNLTSLDPDLASHYASVGPERCTEFVSAVLDRFSADDTIRLFEEFGLLTMTEHGSWVYPVTGRSESVLNVLLRELQRLHVRLKYNVEVIGIDRGENEWQVRTDGWSYPCDSVVLCCGSRAVPSTGSNGTGYELCRGLGMDVTDILPALTAVRCRIPQDDCLVFHAGKQKIDPLRSASGTRVRSDVRIWADGELLACESGQVQFTQEGISGIVIFNLSRYAVRALHEGRDVTLTLDLLPGYDPDDLNRFLARQTELHPDEDLRDLLAGLLPPDLTGLFDPRMSIEETVSRIKRFPLQAQGLRDFENCQVCAGGVSLHEIDPASMECVREDLKGIYIAGELADVDGPCGGYNLQWAWSSGYTAGKHAAGDGVTC